MTKTISIILALLFANMHIAAQELNARVTINAQQIEASYRPRLETMREALEGFINSQQWTNEQFKVNERIECAMAFTIMEIPQTDHYKGTLTIQSRRPVFNASYNTTVLNWNDEEVEFSYTEGMNLTWNEYQASDQDLLALTAYYVYLILGLDFDSFGLGGGQAYYQKALGIVSQMQATGDTPGWKAYDKKNNRHAIISELTAPSSHDKEGHDNTFSSLFYIYHRNGLDAMAQSVEKGRTALTQSLPILKALKSQNIMSPLLTMFITAKQDELINIYSNAPQKEKREVFDLLTDIYPTYSNSLAKIKDSGD